LKFTRRRQKLHTYYRGHSDVRTQKPAGKLGFFFKNKKSKKHVPKIGIKNTGCRDVHLIERPAS
jgi:hypothetical protein